MDAARSAAHQFYLLLLLLLLVLVGDGYLPAVADVIYCYCAGGGDRSKASSSAATEASAALRRRYAWLPIHDPRLLNWVVIRAGHALSAAGRAGPGMEDGRTAICGERSALRACRLTSIYLTSAAGGRQSLQLRHRPSFLPYFLTSPPAELRPAVFVCAQQQCRYNTDRLFLVVIIDFCSSDIKSIILQIQMQLSVVRR